MIAATVTVRTARRHLPFSPPRWGFTFPAGTVVTGTGGLAGRTGRTGLHLFTVAAVALSVLLLGAWVTVFVRTARGTLERPAVPTHNRRPAGADGALIPA